MITNEDEHLGDAVAALRRQSSILDSGLLLDLLEPNNGAWAPPILLGHVQRGENYMEMVTVMFLLCFHRLEVQMQLVVRAMVGVRDELTKVENRLTNVENRLTNVENRLTNVQNGLTNVENDLTELRRSLEDHLVPELGAIRTQLATQTDLLTRRRLLVPPIPVESQAWRNRRVAELQHVALSAETTKQWSRS
jgi:hypothetical protein